MALTDIPDLGQVRTSSNQPRAATPAQITQPPPPPPRCLPQASPPPPDPEQRYIGIPPWWPNFQRRERPTRNRPLPPSADHYMQPEHPWSAHVAAEHARTCYPNSETKDTVWEGQQKDKMPYTWRRRLSIDNFEFFTETIRGYEA